MERLSQFLEAITLESAQQELSSRDFHGVPASMCIRVINFAVSTKHRHRRVIQYIDNPAQTRNETA